MICELGEEGKRETVLKNMCAGVKRIVIKREGERDATLLVGWFVGRVWGKCNLGEEEIFGVEER